MNDPDRKHQLQCYALLADKAPIELPVFIRCAADLFSDEDLTELQNILLENCDVGDLIP